MGYLSNISWNRCNNKLRRFFSIITLASSSFGDISTVIRNHSLYIDPKFFQYDFIVDYHLVIVINKQRWKVPNPFICQQRIYRGLTNELQDLRILINLKSSKSESVRVHIFSFFLALKLNEYERKPGKDWWYFLIV